MARFITGNEFNTGDQVTADTLNNAVNNAKVSTDSVDGSTIDINTSGGVAKLRVKTATGASDGVALANIQHQPANTVLVRDANSTGAVSAKAVADTQVLIGDGTGFTSAALSGDVTMTNAGAVTIADDAVTGAKISDSAALPDGVTATTQSTVDGSTKVATTAYVDNSAVGVGQKWSAVSRAFNTTYTNDTGRPIMTGGQFSGPSDNHEIYITFTYTDGTSAQILLCRSTNSGGSVASAGYVIVPTGASYSFQHTGNGISSFQFYELR